MKKKQLVVAAVVMVGGVFLVRVGDLRGQQVELFPPNDGPAVAERARRIFNDVNVPGPRPPAGKPVPPFARIRETAERLGISDEEALNFLQKNVHNIIQQTPTPTKTPVKTIPVKPPAPEPNPDGGDGNGIGDMLSGLMKAMQGNQQQPKDPSQDEQQAMAAAQQTAEAAALAQQSPSADPEVDVDQAAALAKGAEPAAMAAPAAAPSAAALAASNKESSTSSKPDPEQMERDQKLFPKIELKM